MLSIDTLYKKLLSTTNKSIRYELILTMYKDLC